MTTPSTNTPKSIGHFFTILFFDSHTRFIVFSSPMVVANVAFWLFLLLPFQFALTSVAGSDIPVVRLIIPVIFLLWLLHGLIARKIAFPSPFTLFAFSAFLLWGALSFFWAENPLWGFRKIIFLLNFFMLFLVLTDVFKNSEVRKQAFQGLVWGGGLIAGVGVIQFLAQFFVPLPLLVAACHRSLQFFLGSNFAQAVASYPSILVNIGGVTFLRAFAFFPDPHIFAYYCGMILPLAFYQVLQKKTFSYILLPILLLLGVLLSFSRASYIALLLTTLLLIIFFSWQYKKNISVLVILTLTTSLAGLLFSPVAPRFTSSFSQEDGSVIERGRLWEEAVLNIKHTPFLGVGLGNYPLLVKPSAEPREPIYVHNLYLDLAVEVGIVGLVCFLIFLLSCLPKISFLEQRSFSYPLALLSSLFIFLIHSIFEYPLFSVHILTLLLSLLALLYVEKRNR